MRKKLIGILLILLAALVIVQDYFIKWEISIWMLAWVVLLALLNILFNPSSKTKNRFGLGSTGSDANNGGNDIDVTFSVVTKYLNDQQFTHGSADVSLGQASVYLDNCRIEGPSAQFDVDVSLGSLSLYVPSDWRVHVNVDNSLSAVQHEENPSNLTNKDFYIKGDVSLGNLEIIYVGENAID